MQTKLVFIFFISFMAIFLSCKENENKQENNTEENSIPITGDTQIDFLSKEISQDKLNSELRFKRASLLHDRKMYNEAIEDLRVAITIDSLVPQYYHLLSDVFMDSNISNKALQTMKVVAGLFPERIPTLLKLSETHYIIKQYNESIGVLNSIIGQDAQNAEAYFMLGLNFREMGEEARAMSALQTATEFDSKLIDAWLVLGEMLEQKENPKALEYFEAAVNIAPDNINALHSLAFYKQNHGDIEGSLEIYRQINKIDKFYAEAYLNAGILYLEQNDLEKALEQFEILVAQNQLDPLYQYYKGYTLYLMNDVNGAKASLQNALNLNDDFTRASELLNKISK